MGIVLVHSYLFIYACPEVHSLCENYSLSEAALNNSRVLLVIHFGLLPIAPLTPRFGAFAHFVTPPRAATASASPGYAKYNLEPRVTWQMNEGRFQYIELEWIVLPGTAKCQTWIWTE